MIQIICFQKGIICLLQIVSLVNTFGCTPLLQHCSRAMLKSVLVSLDSFAETKIDIIIEHLSALTLDCHT